MFGLVCFVRLINPPVVWSHIGNVRRTNHLPGSVDGVRRRGVGATEHSPVLRDAINVLGVREADTASILRMLADGFKVGEKAGYVGGKEAENHSIITGWVREPFGQSLHDTAV